MRPLARLLAACAVVLLPGCLPFAIFEDVGSDPHPPTFELLGIAVQPPEPVEGEPLPPPPAFFPVDGFVVHPNDGSANTFLLKYRFSDAGADVVRLKLRDLNGHFNVEVTPGAPEVDLDGDGIPETLEAPEFLPGISGERFIPDVVFDLPQAGPHRFEAWAEDSHGSRSPKVQFTITIVL